MHRKSEISNAKLHDYHSIYKLCLQYVAGYQSFKVAIQSKISSPLYISNRQVRLQSDNLLILHSFHHLVLHIHWYEERRIFEIIVANDVDLPGTCLA